MSRSVPEIQPPVYSTILEWWEAWPEARSELLDFWARGNYSRRLLSRHNGSRESVLVRATYLDEIIAAVKQLVLLGVDIDIAWNGNISPPSLCIVPQDIEYEDTGGWGYSACIGDEIVDPRGGRQWCPAVGFASLLPPSVSNWLAEEAFPWIKDGTIFVAPCAHIGLSTQEYAVTDVHYQNAGKIASGVGRNPSQSLIEVLTELKFPYIESVSLADINKLCADYPDSLARIRAVGRRLLANLGREENLEKEIQSEITELKDAIDELDRSSKTLAFRKMLTTLGGIIKTASIGIAVLENAEPMSKARIVSDGINSILKDWTDIFVERHRIRQHPLYLLWELTRKRGRVRAQPQTKQTLKLGANVKELSRDPIPGYHWLSPPTGGWSVPTAIRADQ